MKSRCPWCLGELPGKPGQVSKCRHCASEIYWGGLKPYKTAEEAKVALQEKALKGLAADLERASKEATPETSNDSPASANTAVETGPSKPSVRQRWVGVGRAWSSWQTRRRERRQDRAWQRQQLLKYGDPDDLTVWWLTWRWYIIFSPVVSIAAILLVVCVLRVSFLGATVGATIWENLTNYSVFAATPINRWGSLTPKVAEALGKHEGELSLNGLIKITPEVAEVLAKHRGDLDLSGLTELTPEVAEALAKHEGSLFLRGVGELSPGVAAALARGLGPTCVGGFGPLDTAKIIQEIAGDPRNLVSYEIHRSPELRVVRSQLFAKAIASDQARLADYEWTPEAEAVLATHPGKLDTDGLTNIKTAQFLDRLCADGFDVGLLSTITPEVAEALAKREGDLNLDGLVELSPEAAEALAKHKGKLSLDSLVRINNVKLAQKLIYSANLSVVPWAPSSPELVKVVARITPDVALALAKDLGGGYVKGLMELTPEMAAALANYEGDLYLSGLVELSAEAARALAKHEGSLRLDGLAELTPLVAEALAKHGGWLRLDGLTELTPEVAEALAKHEGPLDLDGLTELTPLVAGALAKHEGALDLDGLTELTPLVAGALAKHEGALDLNGLTELTPWVAEALAKHRGVLELNGLTELSPEVVKALVKHRGSLSLTGLVRLDSERLAQKLHSGNGDAHWFSMLRGVFLNSIKSLTPEVAEALAKHEDSLWLCGLTELTPLVAEALAKHEGDLHFNGLTALTPEVAKALAKHRGVLELNGLTELTPLVAEALAKHEGCLCLDGLAELTPLVAEALAKHRGFLCLDGLTELTPEVLKALAKHRGDMSLTGLTELTDEVVKAWEEKYQGEVFTLEGFPIEGDRTELSPDLEEKLLRPDPFQFIPDFIPQ